MKKRIILNLGAALIAILSFSVCAADRVSALIPNDRGGSSSSEITDNDIKRKGLYRILHECYTGSLKTSISYKDKDISSVVQGDGAIFSGSSNYYMPTGFYSKDPIYCVYQKPGLTTSAKSGIIDELMSAAANGSSAIGSISARDSDSRTGYYKGMGYTASYSGGEESGTVSGKKCWTLSGSSGSGLSTTSNKLCFTYDENDKITEVTSSGDPTTNGDIEIGLVANYYGHEYGVSYNNTCDSKYFCVIAVVYTEISDYPSPHGYELVPASSDTKGEVTYSIAKSSADMMLDSVGEGISDLPASFKVTMSVTNGSSGGDGGSTPTNIYDTYTISNAEAGYTSAFNYLEGSGHGSATSNKVFDNTELFYIYTSYLSKLYGLQVSYENCDDSDKTSGNEMYIPVVVKDESDKKVMKYCLVDNWGTAYSGNWQKTSVNAGMEYANRLPDKVIELLKALVGSVSISRLPANQMSETTQGQTPEGEDPGEEGEDSKPSCTTNAHELGWILCPIITGVSSFLQDFYEDWIQPFLNIDIGLFRFSGDADSVEDDEAQYSAGNVYQVWTAFQGFANLAFVIVFLVVIFSQLTGIGIDNYGIKKILPKLIVCAVLINLSYIICMVAVELSNILGLAMKSLFSSSTFVPDVSNVVVKVNSATPDSELSHTGWGDLAVVGIVAGLTIPYALSMGWAIIVPALILVVSVLLSLFFLFAMLGIRQALVIILVCISPLAFVCYMLPNTKKLFDKWFNVFKAMLLAYPICSALVYGGDLVAKILIVSNQDASSIISSVGILFTAAIVAIAPVFMIPGLIRKGMDVAGGIGAKLSGVQGKARGFSDTRVKNAGWAKDLNARRDNIQQFKDARRQRRKAGLKEDGTLSRRGKLQNKFAESRIGKHFKGSNTALAKRRAAGLNQVASEMGDKRYMEAAGLAAATAGLIQKQEEGEISDYITNMKDSTNNYNEDTMSSQLTDMYSSGQVDGTRSKALVKQLSATGDGTKKLIDIMRTTNNAQLRKDIASYVTSNEIGGKIAQKDSFVAQYAKDIVSGANGGGAGVSFDDWIKEERTDASGAKTGVQNGAFVASEVLDKDEQLAGQGSKAFNDAITFGGVSEGRAHRMLENENLTSVLDDKKRSMLTTATHGTASPSAKVVNVDNYTHNGRGSRTARLTTYSDGTVRDESGKTVDMKDWTRSVKRK